MPSADTWNSTRAPSHPCTLAPVHLNYHQEVSDTTTNGIRVQVSTQYLPERSAPPKQFLFAYRIRISNVGAETAQLVSRHWVITNTENEERDVRGPGVPNPLN